MNFKEFYLNEDITDNANFMNWFKGSIVVDDQGHPLIVYHGSDKEFRKFSYQFLGSHGRAEGVGFYFTNDKTIATGYGDKLYQVYLSIKKPIDIKARNFSSSVIKRIIVKMVELEEKLGTVKSDGFLSNFGDINYEGYTKVLNYAVELHVDLETAVDFQSSLVGAGVDGEIVNRAIYAVTKHDGIISNGFGGEGINGMKVFIPFFSNQIKIATNSNFSDSDHIDESQEIDINMKNVMYGVEKYKVLTHTIDGELYVTLYHGTSKKNLDKIIRSGKLFNATYLAPEYETAKRFAQMTGHSPVVDTMTIKADGLAFNGNYFYTTREVNRKNGVYK